MRYKSPIRIKMELEYTLYWNILLCYVDYQNMLSNKHTSFYNTLHANFYVEK